LTRWNSGWPGWMTEIYKTAANKKTPYKTVRFFKKVFGPGLYLI